MPEATIDTGNTAWLLVSTALVLLMTPGLALFYGGLNRAKGVLNMMMMSFSAIGLISVLWVLYGFTLAFGTTTAANDISADFDSVPGHQDRSPTELGATGGPERDRHPALRVHRLPDDVRGDHRRADQRRASPTGRSSPAGCCSRSAGSPSSTSRWRTGSGAAGWIGAKLRRAGLRRWYRGAHQRRCGRAGAGAGARQAARLAEGEHEAAQHAARGARRRPAVVRLVRLQRRLRADRRHGRRDWPSSTPRSPPPRRCSAGSWWSGSRRQADPVGASSGAVAGLVAITPACALHRPAGRRCCSAWSPVRSARSRSA